MILARSPYFVNCPATDVSVGTPAYVTLGIAVYSGDKIVIISNQYNLRKNLTGSPASADFEISELVRDFLENVYGGDYTSLATRWVRLEKRYYDSSDNILLLINGLSVITEYQVALNGYSYFPEGASYQPGGLIALSNSCIYTLKNQLPYIPIFAYNTDVDYAFLKDGNIVFNGTLVEENDTVEGQGYVARYISQNGQATYDNFLERVEDAGGVVESSFCLTQFFDSINTFDADKLIVTLSDGSLSDEVDLKYFEDCGIYNKYKVAFVNRFGAVQDLYVTKKSIERLEVQDEVFKFNTTTTGGTYSIYTPQYTRYSVNGRESITLNTPFLPEDYNSVIKELMITEKAWLVNTETNEVTPVIPKTKSLTYKTSVNDKLTQYTIEFDYAYDAINSVR